MKTYLTCLHAAKAQHHQCREMSKAYLQCRMDRQLMSEEDLNDMGYAPDAEVEGASEYDKAREREGFVAGKHIRKPMKWWFQRG